MRFDQVRHYIALAEESVSLREEQNEQALSRQAEYIKQLEQEALQLERMATVLAEELSGLDGTSSEHATQSWLSWARREVKK